MAGLAELLGPIAGDPSSEVDLGPLALPRHEQVSLDEAQRRAPFTAPVPRRAPAGAEPEIIFGAAADRPPTPALVVLAYRLPGHALDVRISQADAATDHALDVAEGAETVAPEGRPRDLVVEMALSLEPAPGHPPPLTG